ncbi:MAG: SHOCT domain-containing protein [Candidatus Helarchaeota archaeon]|nr:SHOCT domain-containing protein [Candidatus Helarchaeota archaeon]
MNDNWRTAFEMDHVKNWMLWDIMRHNDYIFWGYFLTSLAKPQSIKRRISLNTLIFPYNKTEPKVAVDSEIFVNNQGHYEFKEDVSSDESILLSKNFEIDFKDYEEFLPKESPINDGNPLIILKRRLAKGEITKEEYLELKELLDSGET